MLLLILLASTAGEQMYPSSSITKLLGERRREVAARAEVHLADRSRRAENCCDSFRVSWGPDYGPPPAECNHCIQGVCRNAGSMCEATDGAGDGSTGSAGCPSIGIGCQSGAALAQDGFAKMCLSAASYLGDVAFTAVSTADVVGTNGDVNADGTILYSKSQQVSPSSLSPGENIFGPFEAGFGEQQANIITNLAGGESPCAADASKGYIPGGCDVRTAEQIFSKGCGVTVPRIDAGEYISLLDYCGGHTKDYHIHEKLWCLYDHTDIVHGHSTIVGYAKDGQLIYGKNECKRYHFPPTSFHLQRTVAAQILVKVP